jgi:hypothetical protein
VLKIAIGTTIGMIMAVVIVGADVLVWFNLAYFVSEELRASIETACANRIPTTRYLANSLYFAG